jgi:hypothetical protein
MAGAGQRQSRLPIYFHRRRRFAGETILSTRNQGPRTKDQGKIPALAPSSADPPDRNRPSITASCPSLAPSHSARRPIPRLAFSFLATAGEKRACDPGSWFAGVIRSGLCRGDKRLSQLPWRPHRRFALLSDPGRTSTPYQYGASVLPPLVLTRRLPHSLSYGIQ